MYSWEIAKLLELKNYLLEVEEYIKICSSSPQINYIHYDAYNDNFNIKTDNRYDFNFKIKEKKK